MKKITLLIALVVCSFGFAQQAQLQTSANKVQKRAANVKTTSTVTSSVQMLLGDDGKMHTFNPNATTPANRNVLATTLSTLYAGGNGGDPGGAVYFDVTVGPQDIDVTSVDLNTDAAAAFNVDMFAFVGTYVGNQANPAPWGAAVATGSGTGAGVGLPSTATFGTAVTLLANTTYAVALVLDAGGSHTYTNGDGTNQQYSNADLTIDLGSGSNVPFTAPTFNPRVWNGGITYDVSGGGGGDEWTVLVEDLSGNFGDEVSWELRDNGGVVLLSGGPYPNTNYSDMQMVTTANEPLEFFIEAEGMFGDNTPNYTVSCSGNVITSGSLSGGNATESNLVCGGGGGGMCDINYANVLPTINGSPSQIFPDFGEQGGFSADDFVIPLLSTEAAAICDITVSGLYSVVGGVNNDPNSEIILNIYADGGGIPGTLLYTETYDAATIDPTGSAIFTLTPSSSVNLMGGTVYYASVVVRMEFGLAGQYFWSTATDGNDGEFLWQDPDNVYATGCASWMPGSACGVAGGTGPDLIMDINFMQVPGPDECLGAIPMVCGDTETGDTTLNSDTGGANASPDAWYSYTGTGATEFVTFSLCDGGTSYDSLLTVFDSCGGTVVAGNDDSCGLQSEVSFISDGTTTYYVAVEGFATSAGAFSLTVSCNPVAANDLCDDAIAITCDETVLGSTQFATPDQGAPDCGAGNNSPGVWYVIDDATGLPTDYVVSLCDGGTAYDSKLVIFSGDDCGTLVCVAENDDECGLQSEVSFTSDGTSTYYILVNGFGSGNSGDFSLNLSCVPVPPFNDDISNSIDVDEAGLPYTDPAVPMPAATTEAGGSPVNCDNAGVLGVWYNFVATNGGTATATVVSPAGYTSVTFYTAPDENAVETDLTLVDWFDNQCVPGVTTTIPVEAGQAYYVYVANHGGITDIVIDGDFLLGVGDAVVDGFTYFPNPANNELNLDAGIRSIDSATIYNILGQAVVDQNVGASSTRLDVANLSVGTYIMKVVVEGEVGIYKIVKQ